MRPELRNEATMSFGWVADRGSLDGREAFMKRATSFAFAGVSAVALATVLGATVAQAASSPPATGPEYNVQSTNFWLHPPDDWWRAGENEAQKGLVPIPGQPLPTSLADDEKIATQLKVPPGFKVSVWMRRRAAGASRWRGATRARCSSAATSAASSAAITTDANGKRDEEDRPQGVHARHRRGIHGPHAVRCGPLGDLCLGRIQKITSTASGI